MALPYYSPCCSCHDFVSLAANLCHFVQSVVQGLPSDTQLLARAGFAVEVVEAGAQCVQQQRGGGDLESDRAGILEGMHAIVILSPQAAGIAPGDAITLHP